MDNGRNIMDNGFDYVYHGYIHNCTMIELSLIDGCVVPEPQ